MIAALLVLVFFASMSFFGLVFLIWIISVYKDARKWRAVYPLLEQQMKKSVEKGYKITYKVGRKTETKTIDVPTEGEALEKFTKMDTRYTAIESIVRL